MFYCWFCLQRYFDREKTLRHLRETHFERKKPAGDARETRTVLTLAAVGVCNVTLIRYWCQDIEILKYLDLLYCKVMVVESSSSVGLPDEWRNRTEGRTRTGKERSFELMMKVARQPWHHLGTLVVITARNVNVNQVWKLAKKKNYPGISKELAQGWAVG